MAWFCHHDSVTKGIYPCAFSPKCSLFIVKNVIKNNFYAMSPLSEGDDLIGYTIRQTSVPYVTKGAITLGDSLHRGGILCTVWPGTSLCRSHRNITMTYFIMITDVLARNRHQTIRTNMLTWMCQYQCQICHITQHTYRVRERWQGCPPVSSFDIGEFVFS